MYADSYEEDLKLVSGEIKTDFNPILEEYRTAYLKRKEIIDNLFDEIKTIKKLRV